MCFVLIQLYCNVCIYFGNVNDFNGEPHVTIKADWLVHPVQSLQRSLPNIPTPRPARRGPRGTSQQPFLLLSTSADEEANELAAELMCEFAAG